MTITEERMEKALQYLATTDEETAKAKSYLEGKKEQKKTILAVRFLNSEGTGQQKEAEALASDQFDEWKRDYEGAVLDYETLRNRRKTAELLCELWRSLNSNRRQAGGNL